MRPEKLPGGTSGWSFTHLPGILYRYIKTGFKVLVWIVSAFLLMVVVYFIFAVILSVIPVNRKVSTNHEADIYIISNGVHLDMALPIRSEIKNWESDLLIDERITHEARYISFGWGDKLFFMNTPEWSDLTVNTTIKALFLKSSSALHIDYYRSIPVDDRCVKIPVDKAQYKSVVDYIERNFRKDSTGNRILIPGLHYYNSDCFYEANGSYNLFFTCNTWTNKCLKEAGLKASVWTPFDRGTLYHYRK
jgi:uncharacterized protein (TIGR02117 family)